MNKTIILFSFIILIFLSGCGWRENLLSPPDEYIVPEGSLVAECTKDDDTFKFVYQDDGVYQYFINDIEQDEDAVDSIIELAYSHGSSVENYLDDEFPGTCNISDYIYENE